MPHHFHFLQPPSDDSAARSADGFSGSRCRVSGMNVSGMSLFCTPLFTSYSSSNLSHAFNVTFHLRFIISIFCSPQATTLPHEPPAGSQGADAAYPGAHRPLRRGLNEIRPPATPPVLSRLSPFRVCRRRLSRCHRGGRRARRSREQTAIRGSAGAGEVAVEAWDVAVKTAPAERLGGNIQKRTEAEPNAIVRIEDSNEERPNGSGQVGQLCCASSGAQHGVTLTQELSNYSSTPVR